MFVSSVISERPACVRRGWLALERTRDCECVEDEASNENFIIITEWCKAHEIQVGYFMWLHWGGGHEECCDLPGFRLSLNHFSKDEIREAASIVLKERQQEYVDKLLSMI